tara:strand:+ start:2258 stop:2722 length:465 start_codon:yes stop_codon:yes gene_type:complete
MDNKTIIKSNKFIEQVGNKMKKLKIANKKINNDLNQIVEKSTEKEKKAIEDAYKMYNKKIESVLNHPKVKKKIEEKWESDNNISNLTIKIQDAYKKAIQEINRQCTDDEEKANRIKQLTDSIENAILDEDEKKMMRLIKEQMRLLPYQQVRITM